MGNCFFLLFAVCCGSKNSNKVWFSRFNDVLSYHGDGMDRRVKRGISGMKITKPLPGVKFVASSEKAARERKIGGKRKKNEGRLPAFPRAACRFSLLRTI